ncbi:monooxygenase [Acinetobacter rudis]|uniref:Monooxygenase n=1 Tax=Acinetobacter rudis TaxID=632955 RepID=A0AAW8J7H0_9GAMM|nr:monooxygenase [Acinetobacter rudis]MDQ8936076.1 monooxygenase [Acinetobacter rudis]MDQ9018339.1 monooxygenase [Acinetobacter rudis]
MRYILQVDFPFSGPWGEEMALAMQELAQSINHETGMVWKIWTENPEENRAGGIYLFETEQTAKDYLSMHCLRLKSFGIEDIEAKIFIANQALSKLNHGPL